MEGRRRRAQRLEQAQNIEELPEQETLAQQQTPKIQESKTQESKTQASQMQMEETQSAPRRRRRAQPPRQITQRMPKVDVPQEDIPQADASQADMPRSQEIPRMPVINEAPEPVKRYKKSGKKHGRRHAAAPRMGAEKLGKLAKAAVGTGKSVLEGLGGCLLLAMIMIRTGAGKLVQALKNRSGVADAKQKSVAPQAEQEYELEIIRPQDYHGRSKTHVQNSHEKRGHMLRGAKRSALNGNRIAMVLFACVALVSLYQIGSIVIRSVRTNRLNDSLSQQRAAIIQEQAETAESPVEQPQTVVEPEMTPENTMETQPQSTQDTAMVFASAEATAAPDVVKTTKYRRIGGDALPEMAQLYQQNRDLVAWIQIPDVLDLPVVYKDNKYYLTRDFSKQKNTAGTIFLDENHPFKEKTQNLLLHGHNMKDGTMFGRLAQYLHDDTYLRNHPFISFDTLWHKEQYVIFAVLNVSLKPSDQRFFNYFTHDTFSSDAEFSTYIRQLQLRSEFAIPIDVAPSDALLTLSTCLDEDRLVIVCRRLREGETRSELRTLIRMATRQ